MPRANRPSSIDSLSLDHFGLHLNPLKPCYVRRPSVLERVERRSDEQPFPGGNSNMKTQNGFELVAKSDASGIAPRFGENNAEGKSDAAQHAVHCSRSWRILFTGTRVMAALCSLFLAAHLHAQQPPGFVLGLDGVNDYVSI